MEYEILKTLQDAVDNPDLELDVPLDQYIDKGDEDDWAEKIGIEFGDILIDGQDIRWCVTVRDLVNLIMTR